jgi:hypothetical protein
MTAIVDYRREIAAAGISIYDAVTIGDPRLWIPAPELQVILDKALSGLNLTGLPLRTRSKTVKSAICAALGYPVPKSFKKTQPRFFGQSFDTYIQKSNNLQIWNEGISPTRRYVLIRVDSNDVISGVRVVTGDTIAELDTTGTLTQKYQARCVLTDKTLELIASVDTDRLRNHVSRIKVGATSSPSDEPTSGRVLPIEEIFKRLSPLVAKSFKDTGSIKDRLRGDALHMLVSKALGYSHHSDDGQFPDVRNQLLEIKLHTSPTIDLGLVRPDSIEPLDVSMLKNDQVRHCDVRYAVFSGNIQDGIVTLTHLILTTGQAFFTRFPQFGGKVLNAKLQIPLPSDFFT